MFGFLSSPCSSCLGADSHQLYRSYFCGLCNRLRQEYGLWSRWLINRDSTFLSLLAAAQQPACPSPVCTTCCNPLGQKRALHQDGPAVDYAAAITICGLAVKIQDEIDDEQRLRRWSGKMASSFLKGSVEKAKAVLENCGFPAESVRERILEQHDIEQTIQTQRPLDFEIAGVPTAESYAQIVEHSGLLPNSAGANAIALRHLGRSLGSLIYWFDAWQDYEADVRHGRFNPLQFVTQNRRPRIQDRLAAIRPLLEDCQKELASWVRELQLQRYQDLIQWISITGVRTKLGAILPGLLMIEGDEITPEDQKRKTKQGEDPFFCWCCDGTDCACCICTSNMGEGGGECCGDGGCDGCDCPCDCG